MLPTLTVVPGAANAFCDLPGAKYLPICVAQDAAATAVKVVDFATDPLGYIAQQMQLGAAGLTKSVLGGMQDLTHPDLTASWFINAYQVAFGAAVFVWVCLVGAQLVQLARRQVSGDEVISTLSFYTPAFFIGAMLGPLLGTMLVSLSGALSESLVQWGIVTNAEATTQQLLTAIATGDRIGAEFGAVTAMILYGCMILALLLTFLILLVVVITLYLTGVLIPLSLVWLTSPTQRRRGLVLISVWLGLNFSHVLIFFLLGVAFQMVNGLTLSARGAGLQGLANLALAFIALFMATLSPFGLMKFGNAVLPSNGPTGGRVHAPSPPPGIQNLAQGIARDSASAQTARATPSVPEETPPPASAGSGAAGSVGGSSSLVERVKGRSAPSSVSGIEAGEQGTGGPSGSTPMGARPGGAATATAAPKAAPVTGAAPAAAPAAAGLGAGAGGGSGVAAAATAAEAGGAAASSTGVGAAVGVPLMVAGFAVGAVGHMAGQAAGVVDAAVDMTQGQMQHGEDDGQGEPRPRRKD